MYRWNAAHVSGNLGRTWCDLGLAFQQTNYVLAPAVPLKQWGGAEQWRHGAAARRQCGAGGGWRFKRCDHETKEHLPNRFQQQQRDGSRS